MTIVKFDRKACVYVVLLTVIIAGVRFSDGSLLLAIAEGGGADDPSFSTASTQYVWDSPLKIILLKCSPPNIVSIALIFAGLAALPLLGLIARENSLGFYLTAALVTLTPALKLSFQNIGLGDGLVCLLILAAIASSSGFVISLSFLLIGLWHPQQAFFIGGTFFLFSIIYESGRVRCRLAWAMLGLLVASIVFVLYKASLDFEYYDRMSYMADRMIELPLKNLPALPISAFYIVFWGYVIRKCLPRVQLPFYTLAWSFILVAIALLTTDVSRVLSIIALPALLIPMKRMYCESHEDGAETALQLPWIWVAVSILMPLYSWSGFDILLWPDLLHDLCKYHIVCIGGG